VVEAVKIIGLMRVRNEARWIERSVRSILPACDRILVMDDHSTDGTPELLQSIDGVEVLPNPFTGLDETRDKNWLLDQARKADWVVFIDGDEVLEPTGAGRLKFVANTPHAMAFSFPVLYLWDKEDQIRMDGVYGRFARPSMFRPFGYKFEGTAAGGNFHCGNVPLALQRSAIHTNIALLHFGYLHRKDRERKFDWYNRLDPHNPNEDGYRHMVIGDRFPANSVFRHAGPLRLSPLSKRVAA